MNKNRLSLVVVGLLVLVLALSGCGKKEALVNGTVTRTGGAALAGADILLGDEYLTGVDSEGKFGIAGVPFGTYDLVVKMGAEELYTAEVVVSNRKPLNLEITADPADGVIYAQDFELKHGEYPFGWVKFTTAGLGGAYVTDVAYEGTSSFLVTGSAEFADGIRTIRIPATPGKQYTVTYQYTAVNSGVTLYLDFLNAEGARIAAPTKAAASTSEWTLFTHSGVAPEGTVWVAPIFYYSKNTTRQTTFDDVKIVESDAPVTP